MSTLGTFLSSSVSLTSAATTEELMGYVFLGSVIITFTAYVIGGIWMVFSLDLRSHLTICQTALVWGGFVVWGLVSSAFITTILSIFIIQILVTARSDGSSSETRGIDEKLENAGSLTPPYVLFIGLSMGLLLNYRNIGRGWI
jgi:hypothetical protein|tara:strand:- start:244 stop:672 length:429 start_codon:yes stop_codon:yes gene_type:complete